MHCTLQNNTSMSYSIKDYMDQENVLHKHIMLKGKYSSSLKSDDASLNRLQIHVSNVIKDHVQNMSNTQE